MVLSVAYPYAALGNVTVGGAEVVCSQLEAALPELGFDSVLVAHAGSTPEGRLYPTHIPSGTITDELRAQVEAGHQANIDRACAEHHVALLHMHGLDFHRYRLPEGLPVLVTLHLPPSWYPEAIWGLPPNYHLICVSETQRRACPARAQERVAVVGNGVALPGPESLRKEGRYALMLARICPEKNLHTGMEAARLAGTPVLLGGEVFPYQAHERYFAEEIQPRLTSAGKTHSERNGGSGAESAARFLGAVSGEEKQRLLCRAACLLLPSLAPETSSLVAMEALAAGVPVIGMAVGAVPEIVEHGRTGFLIEPGADAAERMASAIARLPELDRAVCRIEAEQRFPLSGMIEAYGVLYRQHAVVGAASRCGKSGGMLASVQDETRGEQESGEQGSDVWETLTSTGALVNLETEWTELWSGDPGATPFQHPSWLLPWWRQFGPDGDLCALTLRSRKTRRLRCFLPLYTYRQPGSGERQLLWVGAGTTDYLDGVWARDAASCADLVLSRLLGGETGWERASLQQLRSSSPFIWGAERVSLPLVQSEACAVLDVSAPLPSKIRVNLNRYRHLAEAKGELACRIAETVEEALASFEVLVQLHSWRWEARGELGVLSDPRVLAHHRESLPKLFGAGLLRMFHLTLSGETMGVLYGLADADHVVERRLYLYLIGFEARFAALSPGSLLVQEAWLHARTQGFAKVDLLRGGEGYKQLWGAVKEATFAIQLR